MSDDQPTRDAFLGGRLLVRQPARGYRAGTDPVFLAAACPARTGDTVLELGCGVGVAALCLASRVSGVVVTGIERQIEYAALARKNAAASGLPVTVVEGDIASLPSDLRQMSFDHVIANPPYFRAADGTAAADAGKDAAFREDTPLHVWVSVAKARLKARGWLTMIQKSDRLPDVLKALDGFGSVSVRPLQPRAQRKAGRFLLRARKGGRAPFALLPPVLVHEGDVHSRDAESYTPEIQAILRDGAALPWPDTR